MVRSPLGVRLPIVLTLLLACGADSPPPSEDPGVPASAPSPGPHPKATDGIPRADGAAYDGRWLIILSSKKDPDHIPDGARALLSGEAGVGLPAGQSLVRLDSTAFKGLQPCYDIVVAGAYDDREAAVAASEALTAAGIDNYPRQPGRFVGAQPQVEAWCQDQSLNVEAACPADVVLGDTHDGRHFLAIPLAEVQFERALEGTATPKRLSDTAWVAPLDAQQLGRFSVGATWQAFGPEGQVAACTTRGFAAVTRGTPHFGWHDTDRSTPGCGTPTVMAELDCAGLDALAWAQPTGGKGRAATAVDEPASSGIAGAQGQVAPTWMTAEMEAAGQARSRGAPLDMEVSVSGWSLGDTELLAFRTTWMTGLGHDECGGDDVRLEVWAASDASGEHLLPARPARTFTSVVPVDVDGDGTFEVWTRDFTGSTALYVGTSTTPACRLAFDFCDCSC